MKLNRSLGISSSIQDLLLNNRLNLFNDYFPKAILGNDRTPKTRNRVYTPQKTLFTMTLTATMEDKTLKNSVNLHYNLHQEEKKLQKQELQKQIELEKSSDNGKVKKRGRPKKYAHGLSKSADKDISLNTAGFSKARKRVPLKMAEDLFKSSRNANIDNDYSHWNGYRVLIGDGTYVQMQDTPELRKRYAVRHNGAESSEYPKGLLETVTDRGTGQLLSFRLSNRHTSELSLFYDMADELPKKGIILLDDLYNTYETFARSISSEVEVLVPAKRTRNYEVIEKIATGDETIEIKKPKTRPKWLPENAIELPETITLRKIDCIGPEGKPYILYTTVLDASITKEEIQNLYFTRWDIEISIREIKTIMDINVLRSKSVEMIHKELLVTLSAYNIIRSIIADSVDDIAFFPKTDFIYKFYTHNKKLLIDKKGRVYQRWSTGRKRTEGSYTKGSFA